MAREWSLLEIKALVEEHIALKEEEKGAVRTASEHWNKVAKKMREKGFNRSHKSCNKRWYRLEQYEVQIFSFNMEEGKQKNFWDLTRAQRLEYHDKWPQLPSGDGIDKEIFDAFKRLSHQYKKEEIISEAMDHAGDVDKEVVLLESKVELTRQSTPPPILVAMPRLTSVPFNHLMVANAELKLEEEFKDSQKQAKDMWLASSEVHQPLFFQNYLDGFKLQARDLKRRQTTELRRNNKTVPYNSTNTKYMKTAPLSQHNAQNSPQVSETTSFGSVIVAPPPATNHIQNLLPEVNSTTITKENVNSSKPPFQFKKPNPFTNQLPQNNHHYIPAQPQPIGSNQATQHCEQQLQKNQNMDGYHGSQFCCNMDQENGNQRSTSASLLGAAIGGLGVQLRTVVTLMEAKHVSEQEFRDKMLMFVECMVVSLHAMAQVNAHTRS